MSKAYTVGGKRRSSQTHASRSWTCACGKTVHGNGGRSAHQRACRAYAESRLAEIERTLGELDAGGWSGRLSPQSVEQIRRDHQSEAAGLRERLASTSRRWVVSEPRWSWLLDGAGRRVELERRRWSPGDVASGFYLYVDETDESPGLFGLTMYSGNLTEAKAEAESALDALDAGEMYEWTLRRYECDAEGA